MPKNTILAWKRFSHLKMSKKPKGGDSLLILTLLMVQVGGPEYEMVLDTFWTGFKIWIQWRS